MTAITKRVYNLQGSAKLLKESRKGFTVVANEVQELAMEKANEPRDIMQPQG